jgi:hypothetical protein
MSPEDQNPLEARPPATVVTVGFEAADALAALAASRAMLEAVVVSNGQHGDAWRLMKLEQR